MKELQEGYIIIATDKRQFLEMALNLALSLKLKDSRPVALVYDKSIEIPGSYKEYFDFQVKILDEDRSGGGFNKLHLYKYSPFQRTMYIDSDCLLAKREIAIIWQRLKKCHFTLCGEKMTKGQRYGLDIAVMINKMRIPYMVKCNAGVLFFDKSKISESVFSRIKKYPIEFSELSIPFRNTFADEPLFSFAMGEFRLEPIPTVFRYWWKTVEWLQCTSGDTRIDVFKNKCLIRWGDTWQNPVIAHFVGKHCSPLDVYLK